MAPSRARLFTAPFLLAAVANFLNGLALNFFLHLPGYLEDLGADELVVGAIVGTMSGAAIAIRPIAGLAMDRSGRRVVILVGSALHVLACALYLTVHELGLWLVVVRAIQGVAQGAIFSSLFTYAADMVPAERRTEGIGIFGVSGILPIAFGGLLGDLVLAHGDYHDLFLVSGAVALLGLFVAIPLREPDRPRGSAGPGPGFFAALRQRDLWPIWVLGASFATALASTYAFLKRFVEEEHVGSVGLFFSAYAASAIALRIFFGSLPDRFGIKRTLYPALGSIAVSLAVLAFARDGVWMVIAGVLSGLGHGYAFPILSALTVTRAHPSDRGSAIALFTAIFDAGLVLGGFAFGAIAELTDLRTMYFLAAFMPIVGLIAFHSWERRASSAPAGE